MGALLRLVVAVIVKLLTKQGSKLLQKIKTLPKKIAEKFPKKKPTSTQPCPKGEESSCKPIQFDKSKSPDQRKIVGGYKTDFPNLGDDYEIKGPATRDYNCIAHSLGINDEWVNPITSDGPNPLAGMDGLYKEQGYQRESGLNFGLEPGKQKVVVYAIKNPDGSIKEVTHGAIQEPNGAYTSKLGSLPNIAHRNPGALTGPAYGEPVAVYSR